jgi:hypothetical protein
VRPHSEILLFLKDSNASFVYVVFEYNKIFFEEPLRKLEILALHSHKVCDESSEELIIVIFDGLRKAKTRHLNRFMTDKRNRKFFRSCESRRPSNRLLIATNQTKGGSEIPMKGRQAPSST